jgi:hypothetical protein
MARLLRPAGLAVITVPNDPLILGIKEVVRRTPIRRLGGGRIEWGGDEYHLHRWTPDEFETLLRRHFRVLERRFAPARLLPVRSCFKCAPLTSAG